jgi:hypothetical protein
MYEETFSTDGECDRAEHASRRSIRRRFEHTVDAETHRRRKTPECMRRCFKQTVDARRLSRHPGEVWGDVFNILCMQTHM